MLRRPSSAIQLCLNRAAECERLAGESRSPEARENYLRIAGHWRMLAEHYDHIERTEAFLGKLPDVPAAEPATGS
jgi:hypothetical protein